MDVTIQKDIHKDSSLGSRFQRLEVVCGPTGRRRWSLAAKARIVAESFRDDVSSCEVARRNELRPSQLYAWRRLAREGRLVLPAEELDIGFAPIVVDGDGAEAMKPEPAASAMIEIAVDGMVVRVCPATAVARIAEIAVALRVSR